MSGNAQSYVPAAITQQLADTRDRISTMVAKLQQQISDLETEKGRDYAAIKTRFDAEVAELNETYASVISDLRDEIKFAQAEFSGVLKAMSVLGNKVEPKPKTVKIQDDTTREMIHDAVIMMLYNSQNGINTDDIKIRLIANNMIDPDKTSAVQNIIGNMVKAGLIERRGNVYVLTDRQDAELRQRVRRIIFNYLKTAGRPVATSEVENEVAGHRILDTTDGRRVHGILLGMSRGQFVNRVEDDDGAKFCAA